MLISVYDMTFGPSLSNEIKCKQKHSWICVFKSKDVDLERMKEDARAVYCSIDVFVGQQKKSFTFLCGFMPYKFETEIAVIAQKAGPTVQCKWQQAWLLTKLPWPHYYG